MFRFESRKSLFLSALASSFALFSAPPARAQINLSPGDVALIGWVDNGTPNDAYALVALANLPAGTTIYFTDNGWDSVSGGFRNTNGPTDGNGNETLAMLTVQTAIPAGTILDTTQTSTSFTWTVSGPIPGAANGTFGSLVLTQTGDQVYAFQQDSGQNPMNTGTRQHLFVLDDTGTFEDATTTGEGNVPPGLSVAGNTAVTFSQSGSTQNVMSFHTTALPSGSKTDWLAAIHDPANWTFGSSGSLPTGSILVTPGVISAFCFGDASTSNPCPCGNVGLPGRGCDNSAHTGGAALDALGSPHPDSVVLQATNLLPHTSALFTQQSSLLAGPNPFGDGLRCTAGVALKIGLKRTATGTARFPDVGDPTVSARSAALGDTIQPGMVRYYQVRYRDPAANFCQSPIGGNFNTTNVIRIAW